MKLRPTAILLVSAAIGLAMSTTACGSDDDTHANTEPCVQVHNVVDINDRTAVAKAVDLVVVVEQTKLDSTRSDGTALPQKTAAFTATPLETIKGEKQAGTTQFLYDDFTTCGGGVKEQLRRNGNYLVYAAQAGGDRRVWKVEELTDAQIQAIVQHDEIHTPAAVRKVRKAVS